MSQIIKPTQSGGGDGFLKSLEGDEGGKVYGDASGNINIVGSDGIDVSGDPGDNTLTISATTDSFLWSDESEPFDADPQHGYFCTGALTVSLPSAGLITGSTIIVFVDTNSTVVIQANVGQNIQLGNQISSGDGQIYIDTVDGQMGSIVTLVWRVSDNTWHSISSIGNWVVV
jgi:hypothetical protein